MWHVACGTWHVACGPPHHITLSSFLAHDQCPAAPQVNALTPAATQEPALCRAALPFRCSGTSSAESGRAWPGDAGRADRDTPPPPRACSQLHCVIHPCTMHCLACHLASPRLDISGIYCFAPHRSCRPNLRRCPSASSPPHPRSFVNKRNLSGFTPLHYAVWGCCEVLVSSLLRFGADMTLTNDRVFDAWVTVPVGSSPLHLAVVRNSVPISLILLQQHVSKRLATVRAHVHAYPAQLDQLVHRCAVCSWILQPPLSASAAANPTALAPALHLHAQTHTHTHTYPHAHTCTHTN